MDGVRQSKLIRVRRLASARREVIGGQCFDAMVEVRVRGRWREAFGGYQRQDAEAMVRRIGPQLVREAGDFYARTEGGAR